MCSPMRSAPTGTGWSRWFLMRPETTALRVVSRARRSLVATRVALANELRANLEIAFPGAATLFSDVDSPIALALLGRFPSVTQAAWLTEPGWRRSCGAWAIPGARPRPSCSGGWPTLRPG
jgi:hypothetical protein